ncbi:serine/threonine protein kinase [Streptomyces sp. NPDC006975]|uniref:serine/threonine-protein kinase n=1 Tax=Streptomyces sp. NPDC006975 TaxID=3154310 RepID=UPI00345523B4
MDGHDGFDLTGSGAEPLQEDDPRRIGPLPLVGRLGSGGMGRVYLGLHEGGYAAVKQVLPSVAGEDKDFLRRFGHELDNLARLPAHATARLIASDREARPPWFATAYVPGLTLREAVDLHGGPLPADALWLLLREAARGLAAVHELGMVHRDVKPSNVMLTVDGLTLIDFGVARAAEQSQLTRTGMVVGTPAYMSPEQASGARRLTGAVDVFALGSVVAYAGCGRPPFGDESGHAVLYRIVHEEPDLAPLRALDPDLASAVASCLDKDPEGRPTAAELLDLATAHAPETPAWPAAVAERLAERAAFAATPPPPPPHPTATTPAPTPGDPEPTTPAPEPAPDPAPGPEPDQEPHSKPNPDPNPDQEPAPPPVVATRPAPDRERRRTRVLLAVVPVVVVATVTTVALQLLPYASAPSHGDAGPSASAQVASSAPASATTPSATAPTTAQPSSGQPTASPGGPAGPATAAGAAAVGGGAGGTDAGNAAGGQGGRTGTGSHTGTGTGSSSGSGSTGTGTGSGSGSGSGWGSGSGSGTGAGTSTSAPPPSSGYVHLRNGQNGKCVTEMYSSTLLGACSGAAASWAFRSAANGTYKLVNQSSGHCLNGSYNGQTVVVGDCAGTGTALLWRAGSGSTLVNSFSGGCLDLAFNGGVTTQTCQSGAASQKWARA